MKKVGDFVVKNKIVILIVSVLLLIPAIIGMVNTKVNYNILVYLPSDIETMKGQEILTDDFNLASYAISIFDNVDAKDALKYENEIKNVSGVNKVVSLYDVVGTQIPLEMLPAEVQDKLVKGDSTLLLITFNDSISDENTLKAVKDIREIAKDDIEIGGMSSMVLDTRNLSDSEVTAYVLIAVACCIIVLMLTLDSYTVPIILLANIGIAVLYNMGTNILLGDISYITKAISAILQLGVTTDFSIFLYHQYEQAKKECKNKNEAMSKAIGETINSIIGSSTTTIAGFLALCAMQLTLGADIGIVMAKGVLFGVLCVIVLFPSLILVFDKLIEKTSHKPIIPEFKHVKNFVIKKYKWIFIAFLILIIPAWWGQKNTEVYYNLDKSLPTTLASSVANADLEKKYNIVSPMIVLVPKDLSNNDINNMISEIENLDNIDFVMSYSKLYDLNIPEEMIDDDIKSIFESDKYYLVLINSNYEKATSELNNQIDSINSIVKGYDDDSIVAGEGALVKDLVEISDTDFHNVSYASIGVILIIIIFVLKSYSLPIILVSAIEFAIFINMAVPYYTGVTIPFVSSIVIGTIQLGATIDYAILMTNKFLDKRKTGADKFESIKYALDNSVSSIFVSGMCFFAATFGVGIYSKLEMVGSLCSLIARGAIISMLVVILVLPTLLLMFDKIITKSTKGFKKGDNKMINKSIKAALIGLIALIPLNTNALTKEETVYVNADNTGKEIKTIVSEHLINDKKNSSIKDISYLTDIVNTNGDETYKADGKSLVWNSSKDIYYKGLTNKSLPVDMSIKYYLDCKLVDQNKDIKGKKGHVKVVINYTNNEKHGSLYTPFTVLMGTSLTNEDNTNIKVTTGSVMDNGKTSVIAGIAMPGLSQSLSMNTLSGLNKVVIEYDTTNADTLSMYSIITPKFINTNELSSKLDALYSSVDLMSSSSKALVNGASELSNGINELNNSYAKINSGISELSKGLTGAASTYDEQINKNLQAVNSGLAQLNNNAGSLEQLVTAINGLADLTQRLAEVTTSLEAIQDGYALKEDAMTTIISGLTDDQKLQYQKQIAIVNAPMDLRSLTTLSDNIETLNIKVQELKIQAQGLLVVKNSINQLSNGLNGIATGSNEFKNQLSDTAKNQTTLLVTGSNKVSAGLNKLNAGSTILANGVAKFDTDAISSLVNIVNNTVKGKVSTLKQLNNLSNSYNSFGGSNSTKSNTKFIIRTSK